MLVDSRRGEHGGRRARDVERDARRCGIDADVVAVGGEARAVGRPADEAVELGEVGVGGGAAEDELAALASSGSWSIGASCFGVSVNVRAADDERHGRRERLPGVGLRRRQVGGR